jgi:hypothetical protein
VGGDDDQVSKYLPVAKSGEQSHLRTLVVVVGLCTFSYRLTGKFNTETLPERRFFHSERATYVQLGNLKNESIFKVPTQAILIAVRYIFPKKIEKRLVQEQWD